MDCFRWAREEVGTAPFPKAKEFEKIKVGAYDQEEDSESEIDLYIPDEEEDFEEECSEDKEEPEKALEEKFSDQKSEREESVSPKTNWWDDYRSNRE